MKYRVSWQPIAKQQIERIWQTADDVASVKRAALTIEAILSVDPHDVGESRLPGIRIVVISPLTAYFTIDDARLEVIVLSVFSH